MNVRIRPAEPTDRDAAAFADLANMASHDVLADMLGAEFRQTLAAMFLAEDTLYSHGFVRVVEVDRQIVAMLCAFSGQHKADLNTATDRYFTDFPGADSKPLARIRDQLQPLSDLIDSVPIDAYYIQFLAVYPHARGHGRARQLLALAHDLAREHGAATLELDVETGNEIALSAYRGNGLQISHTSPFVTYDKQQRVFALHRMVKGLAP